MNREHALLQEVAALEEDTEESSLQRIEGLEAKLASAQDQIAELVQLQRALVQHLLPEEAVKKLLPPQDGADERNLGSGKA